MVPAAIPFLLGFLSDIVQPTWMVDEYIPFVLSLVFWVGISFEMPLVCYFLARLGIITSRQLIKGWRFAILGIAVLSAAITPTPDPFNMMLVMIPLLLLFLLGVFLAWIAGRQLQKKLAATWDSRYPQADRFDPLLAFNQNIDQAQVLAEYGICYMQTQLTPPDKGLPGGQYKPPTSSNW